jgi:hypothetical protein
MYVCHLRTNCTCVRLLNCQVSIRSKAHTGDHERHLVDARGRRSCCNTWMLSPLPFITQSLCCLGTPLLFRLPLTPSAAVTLRLCWLMGQLLT